MAEGKNIEPKNVEQSQYKSTFNNVMLCKEFGWTEKEINETSVDFYNDCITILGLLNAKQEARNKRKR